MARTIDEIYQAIIVAKNSKTELDALNSTSKVAVYNMFAYIVAVVIWSLENLFDLHKAEVDDAIATKKPHNPRWYRGQALKFRFGQDFNEVAGSYDNAGLSDEQIAVMLIIAQASVTEVDGKLRIKTAKEVGGDLEPLDVNEKAAFNEYVQLVKDAGVKIINDSLPADDLKLILDIWYNPLVLRSDGSRIDGNSDTPVKDGIQAYLRTLPFNGEYANLKLVNLLETIDGVVFPVIKIAQAKYGLFAFASIDEKYIPDAGYLRASDANLTINYREYVQS